MRNVILLLICFLYFPEFLSAQTERHIKFNFASPTPFSLTKYSGGQDIIEASGKYRKEILLETYQVGKLTLPVSLIYTGAGVKVDQVATKTGINWCLNAGGVITRTVADKADEKWERKFYTFDLLDRLSTSVAGVDEIKSLSSDPYNDTEVDIFQFKFGNYSGSFYFDKNNDPQLINKREDIIIKAPNFFSGDPNPEIIITTNDGEKYYFGGIGGCETTRTIIGLNKSQPDITSFYLTKITNETGDVIFLKYMDLKAEKTTQQAIIETYSETHSYSFPYDSNWPSAKDYNYSQTTILQKITNAKILEKIYSNLNDYEINFISRILPNQHFYEVLDEIKVKKNNQDKSYKLQYISKEKLENSSRFFLSKILYFKNDNPVNEHILEYNNFDTMPGRLSFSKDYLGYANGSSSNTALNLTNFSLAFPAATGGWSDTSPSFSNGIAGTLRKIVYPTRGSTEITYEPNKYWDYNMKKVNLKTYYNKPNIIPNNKLTDGFGFNTEIGTSFLPSIDQDVDFNLEITTTTPKYVNNHYKVKVEIIDFSDNINSKSEIYSLNYGDTKILKTIPVNLKKNNPYTFRVSLIIPPYASGEASITAEAYILYANGKKIVDGEGIRVKSIVENDGNTTTKRNFYYSNAHDINDISKLERRDLSKIITNTQPETSSLNFRYSSPGEGGHATFFGIRTINSSIYSSGAYNSITLTDPEFYSVVSIGMGDNYENGLIEKSFIKDNDTYMSTFKPDNKLFSGFQQYSKSSNGSNFNGTLLKERIFKNYRGELFMVKDKTNKYKEETASFIENIVTQKILEDRGWAEEYYTDYYDKKLSNYYIGIYKTNELELLLEQTTIKDYLSPVPLSDLGNTDSYRFLETIYDFKYSPHVFGISKEVTTTFPDSTKKQTTYSYAHDKNNQYMIDKNMVGIPLETKVVLKQNEQDPGKVISGRETLYPTSQQQASSITKGLPLPYAERALELESALIKDELTYDRYDDKGNLLQYTTKTGISTTVIWGYNKTQPIAKIEGAKLSDIPGSLITELQDASDYGNAGYSENILIAKLDEVRKSYPQFQITTYTYKPLVGVTSITPPSGLRAVYEYDSAGRLKSVKDLEGRELKKYEYHYKNP